MRGACLVVLATFGFDSTALAQALITAPAPIPAPAPVMAPEPRPLPAPSHPESEAPAVELALSSDPTTTAEHTYPAGWNLVSVPLLPTDAAPSAVFDEVPAPLRLYDYVDGQVLAAGEAGFRNVAPGRAFWMLLAAPVAVRATGEPVATDAEYRIALKPGWNAIGTPWLASVGWSDGQVWVRNGSSTLALGAAVDQGWIEGTLDDPDPAGVYSALTANSSPAGRLRPWRGYLLYSQITGELILGPPPPDTTPPTVAFDTPAEEAEIPTPTNVVGTADDDSLVGWTLEYSVAGAPFALLASGNQAVSAATLARIDPTLFENGIAVLRLTASDAAGLTATAERTVLIAGQRNKLGAFRITFKDVEVPLSGIPISVYRDYDTRRRGSSLDFGFGWTVEVGARGRYTNNRKPGDGWEFKSGSGPFGLPCQTVDATKSHVTEIRFTDREFYRFELKVTGGPTLGGCLGTASFVQTDGRPGATLRIVGDDEVFWQNGTKVLIDPFTGEVFDPANVELTTLGGRRFVVNRRDGVTQVTDTNGNTLNITPGGVVHSSGRSVAFTRDAAGRIVAVTDPLGRITSYGYDAAGNLISATDPSGGVTAFEYLPGHYLSKITDPLGRMPVRMEYDDEGRLAAVIDGQGHRSEIQNDAQTGVSVSTDRLGNVTRHAYDADGNLAETTDPNGHTTRYTYDARGNQLTETNALGETRTRTYDAKENVLTETDPLGHTTQRTYDADGHALTTTDARGKVTTHTYDSAGNPITSRDALGNSTGFAYDGAGRLITQTDALGCAVTSDYDGFGNRRSETDALGHVTSYTHDAKGNVLTRTATRTRADGTSETLVTRYKYDAGDRLVEQTDPDGGLTLWVYDLAGQKTSTKDRLGRETRFEYDELGQLTRTTFPDGTTEESTYDLEGRRVESRDRGGRLTRYEHDKAGQLIRTTLPDGSFTEQTYDAAGRALTQKDARGNVTTFEYDAAGRRTTVRDALGQESTFVYDANDNQASMRDGRGNPTTYEYDELNRVVRTVFPDGTEKRTTYDPAGRVAGETDAAGKTTRFGYDCRGRLVSVTDALGQVTAFAYDELGNRISQTDANGRTTRFEYDMVGRRARRVLPGGLGETVTLDAAGNILTRTDFGGAVTQYTYDLDDRQLTRSYPDGSAVTNTYAPTGPVLTVQDGRGLTRFERDALDRVTRLTYPDGRRLEYAYDAQGNRTRLAAVVGATTLTTSYAYDALNRLSVVTDPQGREYRQTYDPNGNRSTLSYPNGAATTYTYDKLNRLTRLQTARGGLVLQSYDYALGPTGNRTQIVDSAGIEHSYGYDGLYRLIRETVRETVAGPVRYEKTFGYDRVGNRLSQSTTGQGAGSVTYTYDERDRLVTENGANLTWDANGNLGSRLGEASYAWDFENRLLRVQKVGGPRVDHAYDADGNRVRTEVTPANGPPATNLLVDPTCRLCEAVAESDAGGNVTAYYVRGDDLLSVIRPSGTRFFHSDALGSVRHLTNEGGQVTDSYSFSAFGELLSHTGTDPNPYLFAGLPFESNSGLYDSRARWLEPRTGRFASIDPFEGDPADPGSLHPYTYAHLDPVDNTDPTGLVTLGGQMQVTQMSSTLNATARPLYREFLKKAAQVVICQASVRTIKLALSDQGHHPLPKFMGGQQKQVLIFLNPDLHRSFHQVLHLIVSTSGLFGGLGALGGVAGSAASWAAAFAEKKAEQAVAFGAVLAAARIIDTKCKLKGKDSLTYHVLQSFKSGAFDPM